MISFIFIVILALKNIVIFIDITVRPQSVNATHKSTVSFTCEADIGDITFLIDSTLAYLQMLLTEDLLNKV